MTKRKVVAMKDQARRGVKPPVKKVIQIKEALPSDPKECLAAAPGLPFVPAKLPLLLSLSFIPMDPFSRCIDRNIPRIK